MKAHNNALGRPIQVERTQNGVEKNVSIQNNLGKLWKILLEGKFVLRIFDWLNRSFCFKK